MTTPPRWQLPLKKSIDQWPPDHHQTINRSSPMSNTWSSMTWSRGKFEITSGWFGLLFFWKYFFGPGVLSRAFLWLLWIKDEKEVWGRPSSYLLSASAPGHQCQFTSVPVDQCISFPVPVHQYTSSAVHQYTSAVAVHQVNPWLNWPPGRPSCCNNFNRCNNFDSCNNFNSFNNVKKSSYFENLKCHVFYFHHSKITHRYESLEEWVKA